MVGPELRGRTLGEFVLRERIDGGGFSEVYRAEQPRLRREVAIKVLHEELQQDEVAPERFHREAKLASQLHHPYAAHIFDFGVEDNGLSWIAMELVQGVTLKRWLLKHGRMPLEKFVPFFEGIAEVVQFAHNRGIVHRDLKPSNVMVIESAGRLFPKLLDLGIAKVHRKIAPQMPQNRPASLAADESPPQPTRIESGSGPLADVKRLTPSYVRIGSPPYMAPELWKDAYRAGPAADVYALGAVAYESLTGDPPFSADTHDEYYVQHLYEPVRQIFVPNLDRIFTRALAKSPRDRHRTVLELAADLRGALRANQREQLRSSAQRWEDQGRPRGLLWGRDVLADLEPWVLEGVLSDLERSFLMTSQRFVRRSTWVRGSGVALAAISGVGVFLYCEGMQTQLAQEQARASERVTEATITQAELEQGRSALLHGEPEAQLHLGRAYHRGDHSPSTAFLYARALQPKLAEQARFASASGRMWSAAFSPGGRQIVTTDDSGAQVRDAQTYRMRFVLPHGHEVYQAVYSADGAQLITAAEDAVRIWDAASGALVHTLARKRSDGKPTDYFAMALAQDGRLVAAIDAAGSMVHVWDAVTGAALAELRSDPMEYPGLAFSSDGRWLAVTGGNDVRVFNTRTWRLACTIRGPHVHSLAFDSTGRRLITGAATGDVAIWSIPDSARIHHLREIGDPVDAVAFSPDGQLVIAASRDGAEQVWQAGSGALQSQFNPRHTKILAVEFDRTSKLVLAAGGDGTVVVADAALGMPLTMLEGPAGGVRVAHFDSSSHRVVGASLDGTARIWDATSLYRRWSSPPLSDDCGISTSAEPDRRFIAVGCRDHATRVWDMARDQLLAELPSVSHIDGDFTSAFPAVSSAGDRAAIARGNTVEIYELPGGHLLRTIAHGAPVNTVAFASTGRDIVSGSIDGSLIVTRDNGVQVALPSASGGIDAAEFLSDGRVVAADAQRRLRIYSPAGSVLADLEIPARAMALRLDGARLVTIPIVPIHPGKAAPPVVLDLERYQVVARLEGHVGRVFSARWVAGNHIITAGADGTARLWDGSTGQLRHTFRGSSRRLADATLMPDGLVIAGGDDGLLRFWDTSSERLLWALQAHKSLIGLHVEGGDIVTRGFSGELSRWALPSTEQVIESCDGQERCAIMQR